MTSDFWKETITKTDYLSLTYHFIDAEWEMQKRLLFCAEYDSTVQKKAGLVRDFLFEKLAVFGLTDDICKDLYFVTDAGGNMINAFENAGPGKSKLNRISCAAHQLNTGLSNCFNRKPKSQFRMPEETESVWKLLCDAKELVGHVNKTDLAKVLKKKLIQSIDVRWNTKLTMLDSILEQYDDLKIALQARDELEMLPGPVNKQTDRQADRQTDRQIDKHRNILCEKNTYLTILSLCSHFILTLYRTERVFGGAHCFPVAV